MPTAKQVRMRRGTTLDNNLFTGPAGEVTVDTTVKTLRVHDGVTVGGTTLALANLSNVPADSSFEQRIMTAVQALLSSSGGTGSGDETMFIGGVKEAFGTPGSNYLPANGQLVKKADYPALYQTIGNTYNLVGNGASPSTVVTPTTSMANTPVNSFVLSNGNLVSLCTTGPTGLGSALSTTTPAGVTTTFYAPSDISLTRFYMIGNQATAFGAGRTITSTDGVTWTATANNLTGLTISTISYNGGKFMASTNNASPWSFVTSTDAVTWTIQPTTTTAFVAITSVLYSSRLNVYFVFNGTGQIWSTPNFTTWTQVQATSTTNYNAYFVFELPDRIIVQGGNSLNYAMYSLNGTTWTTVAQAAFGTYTSGGSNSYTLYSPATGRVYTMNSTSIFSSSDGATWNVQALSSIGINPNTGSPPPIKGFATSATAVYALAYPSGLSPVLITATSTTTSGFTVVGNTLGVKDASIVNVDSTSGAIWLSGASGALSGNNVLKSSDGGQTFRWYLAKSTNATFTTRTKSSSATISGVSKQITVAQSNNSTQLIYNENQGANPQIPITGVGRIQGSLFANNTFVVYGHFGGLSKSANGTSWTLLTGMPATETILGMSYNGTVWLAACATGNIYTSPDLATWTLKSTILTPTVVTGSASTVFANWNILWTGSKWVINNNGTSIASSADAVTWTTAAIPATITGMAYGNGRLVLMCANATYMSADLVNFTYSATTVGVKVNQSITFGNGVFVIGGGDSAATPTGYATFNTSPDGLAWNPETLSTLGYIKRVVYGNGYFAAAGSYYVGAVLYYAIWTSYDGVRWSLAGSTQTASSFDDLMVQQDIGFTTTSSAGTPTVLSVGLTDPAYFRIPFIPPVGDYGGNHYMQYQ